MDIQNQIKQVISEHLGVAEEEINLNSHLQDDLNSDPLSMADIVISLEDKFTIEIPAEESQRFNTVGDICNYISDVLGEI